VLALVLGVVAACSDGDDDRPGGSTTDDSTGEEQAQLQGLLDAQEAEVGALPEERTEHTTAEVEADATTEGYEHPVGSLRVLGDDPGLDELAVACFHADLSSCDVLYDESPGGSLYEAYAATCGARIDEPTNRLCVDVLLPPADAWEDLGPDAFLSELARQCHDGDLLDCDLLFAEADRGTQFEAYGATCGRRVEGDADSIDLDCTELFEL
jgi:hypothetical protein